MTGAKIAEPMTEERLEEIINRMSTALQKGEDDTGRRDAARSVLVHYDIPDLLAEVDRLRSEAGQRRRDRRDAYYRAALIGFMAGPVGTDKTLGEIVTEIAEKAMAAADKANEEELAREYKEG